LKETRNPQAGNRSFCPHGKGNVGPKSKTKEMAGILAAIKERRE
jgi:hypothetical protein